MGVNVGVLVGVRVAVGGTGVFVGVLVAVGGTGVLVRVLVAVGGTGVFVGVLVAVGVCVAVLVGGAVDAHWSAQKESPLPWKASSNREP